MTKSLYDPEIEKKGIEKEKIEIAKKMLSKNFSIEDICEITGISLEKINEIKKYKN